ncbi:c-type cytochrome [uncultured Lutibacter sp.]|uniref:c-type cytochrome n=1 Tax=uncultured Lutibacter sp. TaxID=437739 RepID=UPI00261CFDD3|nr:c-type cytochrome [uncultured Lutibacter sp.]
MKNYLLLLFFLSSFSYSQNFKINSTEQKIVEASTKFLRGLQTENMSLFYTDFLEKESDVYRKLEAGHQRIYTEKSGRYELFKYFLENYRQKSDSDSYMKYVVIFKRENNFGTVDFIYGNYENSYKFHGLYYVQFNNTIYFGFRNDDFKKIDITKEKEILYTPLYPYASVIDTQSNKIINSYENNTMVQRGKVLFESKTCTACHLKDGGGSIGPNLTDNYWINGGTYEDIFKTISKGGRAGKGMIAWESTITSKDRQALTYYIVSLRGTKPENPKEPEGQFSEF